MTMSVEQPGSDAREIRGTERAPRILIYSDDSAVRETVRLAVGPRLRAGAARIEWLEIATHAKIIDGTQISSFDLLILDGETDKSGGMGISRQLKDEIYECPPVLLLTARPDDAWLASWSLADAVVSRPLDPIELQRKVAELVTARRAA